jgi:acyl-CoA thioester hydrolase
MGYTSIKLGIAPFFHFNARSPQAHTGIVLSTSSGKTRQLRNETVSCQTNLANVGHCDILWGRFEMDFPKRTTNQSHTIAIVPRYVETDQGGVVHHSVYPVWFEMGRTELLRVNGLAYKDLERTGVFLVVVELHVKFRKSAKYDEKLQLLTTCSAVTASTIEHTYKLTRCSDNTVLAEGSSILACINSKGKTCRIPALLCPETAKTIV